jgi:hypothetical protein
MRLRHSRAARWAATLVVVYVALGLAFALVSQSRGLLSPGGTPHLDVMLLGGAYLLTRVAVRFALPALVVYALARLWRGAPWAR